MHPDHWQPLVYVNDTGERVIQRFAGAHWSTVRPFALSKPDEFRPDTGPARFGSANFSLQTEETIALSAGLTDRQKAIAEYWTDGVNTEQPAGHWLRIGEWVSERDHHTLDDDVKFFFVLSNALFDASIAAWDSKAAFDSIRPISAVALVYRGKLIEAWGGPGKGTIKMDGGQWCPYQRADSPTPPFPEFVSGHSAYSAAAAEILKQWTGSDAYGNSVAVAAGSSKIEPGVVPRASVMLSWKTFSEAADEAGMSGRYGGIHFKAGDEAGRLLGRRVARKVWFTFQGYLKGDVSERPLLSPADYATLSK